MSTIKIDSQQVRFNFHVPIDLSRGSLQFETSEIVAAEIPWKIRLRKIATDGSIEMRLMCNYKETRTNSNWCIEAASILRLLTYSETKKYIEIVIPTTKFDNERNRSHGKHLIFCNGLIDKDYDFIGKNNVLRFEAVIISVPLRQLDDAITRIHSTKLGIVLKDMVHLDLIQTPRIILSDTEWYIEFSKENKWLDVTLFRKFESENFGWAFNVKCTVKLLTQALSAGNVEYKFDRCFTSASTGIGWPKFITWDELLDKKNGYIENKNAMFNITIDVGLKEPFWENDGVRLATVSE